LSKIEPTSLRKGGRGSWGSILACEGAKAELTEPTSLNRREGLIARLIGMVGGIEGEGKGKDGSGGRSENELHINCDTVDVKFKLCSPP
jgi:hypothetical protein